MIALFPGTKKMMRDQTHTSSHGIIHWRHWGTYWRRAVTSEGHWCYPPIVGNMRRNNFYGSSNIQRGWKDYQGIINNTYHGGHLETDHNVIWLMPEDVTKNYVFPNFTTSMIGTLGEVLDNDMTPRDKISLKRLGGTKGKSGGLSKMLITGM